MSYTSVQSKSSPFIITVLLTSFTLLGCGQKGPLKIEEPVVKQEDAESKQAVPAFSKHAEGTSINEESRKQKGEQQVFSQDY